MPSLCNYFSYRDLKCSRITNDEIEEVVSLINKEYSYQDAYRRSPRTNHKNLEEHISESEFYVFKHNNRIIGCVYIEMNSTQKVYFGLLTIDKQYGSMGIGKEITKSVERYVKSIGKTELLLAYMHIAPWLKSYYEKLGFKENGDEWNWDGIRLMHMHKTLS